MNRLQSIEVKGRDGVKGWTGRVTLGGCDSVTGPNGAGKSLLLLALDAGLHGLATSDTDTLTVAKDGTVQPERAYLGELPDATVVLTFDTGAPLVRKLSEGPRTKGAKVASQRAATLVGEGLVRWDLGDFSRAGSAARKAVFDQVLRVGGAGASWTGDRVLGGLCERLDLPLVDVLGGEGPLCDLIEQRPLDGAGVADWLQGAVALVGPGEGTWYTTSNKAAGEAVVAVDAAQAALDQELPPGTLQQARQRVADLEDRLGVLREEGATAQQRQRAVVTRETRTGELVAAVDAAQGRLDTARLAYRDAQATLTGLRGDTATLRAAVDEAQADLEAAGEKVSVSKVRVLTAISTAAQESGKATALSARVETLAGLVSGVGGSICRHCGEVDPLGLTEQLTESRVERDAAQVVADKAAGFLSTMERFRDSAQSKHTLAGERRATAGEALRRNADQITSQEAAVKRAASAVDEAEDAVKAAEDRLTAHQAEVVDTGSGSLDTIKAEADALKALLGDEKEPAKDTARWTRNEHQAAVDRSAKLQAAIADREQKALRFEQTKALSAALKDIQSQVARDAYGPVCGAAQELLDECGAGLRVEIRSESDFGAHVDPAVWPARHLSREVYVPWWALSGAQRALVGVALAVAFARLGGSPWPAVVLDDFEHVDSRHRDRVIAGLSGMVASRRLANVLIGMVAEERPEEAEGVTLHWLGEDAGEARGAA